MKKWRKYALSGLLSLLFSGMVYAADDNIKIYDTTTNNTKNRSVIFFNKYLENNLNEEMFSGSTTTSGGTSTFRAGVVNVEDLFNDKEFSILMTPTTAGSVTVKFYGVWGTTTVTADVGTNTVGCAELFSKRTTIQGTAGTSTTVTITDNPNLIAVSTTVTSGTATISVGMHSQTQR